MSGEKSAYEAQQTDRWYLYLLRTAAGTLYCGITKDVERRFAEHSSGGPRAARALRGRGPFRLEYQHQAGTHGQALRLEAAIKKWRKAEKEKLIAGERSLPIINK